MTSYKKKKIVGGGAHYIYYRNVIENLTALQFSDSARLPFR